MVIFVVMAIHLERRVTLSTAALVHGASAQGAAYVKKGYTFSPEMDLAFALGYPHFVYLADGHPADEDPAVLGSQFIADNARDITIWPREVAYRAARAWSSLNNASLRAERFKEDKGPIREDEAADIVRTRLRAFRGDVLMLLLEGMVGPDVVADAAVSAMETYGEEDWDAMGGAPYALGFVLLRLPAATAEKLRGRLHAVQSRVQKAGWNTRSIRDLDVMLHGLEGAERSAYRPSGTHISRMYTTLVNDDPTWVAKTVLAGGPPDESLWPDPRMSFLGGEAVLDVECRWWKHYTRPDAHAVFVDRFGHVRSEKLLSTFLEMTSGSNAKKLATAWFLAHASFARAFLQREKANGSEAAKRILRTIALTEPS